MLPDNSLRSILIVSTASLAGSISAILIINRFKRSVILFATFSLLSLLFAVGGASLIATYEDNENHIVTTVFYAILQFVFNLGPNPLIFALPAEIFPTVYRGTFYGVAAACGKIGAVVIRAIMTAATDQDIPLGVAFLVFAPLMLLAAGMSLHVPEVQSSLAPTETELEQGAGSESRTDEAGRISQGRVTPSGPLKSLALEGIAPYPPSKQNGVQNDSQPMMNGGV